MAAYAWDILSSIWNGIRLLALVTFLFWIGVAGVRR